jgi:hypothetical protein
MNEVVVRYTIPTSLENRFEWLSAGDSQVKQELLNHFLEHEKTFVIEGARQRVPVLLEHLRSRAGANTYRAAEVLKIGNHELEVTVDRNASGARLEEPHVAPPWRQPLQPANANTAPSYRWLYWLVGAIFVLYLLGHL